MSAFRVLCADPPWSFGDALGRRGAAANYPVMSLVDLAVFPLPPLADNCLLFMWRVSSQVKEAHTIAEAWGFTPKTEIVWQKLTKNGKPHFGMGRYVRASHETCLVAVRGRVAVTDRGIRSTFSAPTGAHSEKPEVFYRDIVEKLSPGPYCELFGRRPRDGWTVYGNELPGGMAA